MGITRDGLAFVGTEGSGLVIQREEFLAATVGRVPRTMFPGLKLALRDGRCFWVTFPAEPAVWDQRSRAQRAVRQLGF